MKYLKIKSLLAVLFLLVALDGNAQEKGGNIAGLYWSPKKDAKIEIYKKAGKYYGKSIWMASPKKDVKNPDKTLQTRDVLGIELLADFSYKDGSYTDGTIYDPESGKTYDCKMNLTANNLKVRGYIGISLFGRTENFERIK